MKVLLSDGSSLTARQVANRLAAAGHVIEALAPDPLCLCRFTRKVRRIHPVPRYGTDPLGWLEAALAVYRAGRFDVLFPTQEQVAALSLTSERLAASGVSTVVPPFSALAAVQDKVSAFTTLSRLDLPQPHTAIDTAGWNRFPAFVKEAVGTASGGVRCVRTADELHLAAAGNTRVIVQAAVEGPLAMCQSVFDHGRLLAFHANLRTGEGAKGGASHKQSVDLPRCRRYLEILGGDLRWHGALSADVILHRDGPLFIDLNPRLVEPDNAWRSGVDLVGPMLELGLGSNPDPQPPGVSGVSTHQLLLAILGAAQSGNRRRGVARELLSAWRHQGQYGQSVEELTPVASDPPAAIPVLMAAAATLVRPGSWSWFTSSSVASYALTAEGWHQILSAATAADPALPAVR